jgi:cob(I)alamin adenosyltransferase
MKVYTKTGDGGTTSLYNGERIEKNTCIMEALGDLDELNVSIGAFSCKLSEFNVQLLSIQSTLIDIGASITTPWTRSSEKELEKTKFDTEKTPKLEEWIDEMSERLPELTTFVLPAGDPTVVQIHIARVVCRRAERSVLNVKCNVDPAILVYINRLSDVFFVLARYVMYNHASCMEYTYPFEPAQFKIVTFPLGVPLGMYTALGLVAMMLARMLFLY